MTVDLKLVWSIPGCFFLLEVHGTRIFFLIIVFAG